MAPSRTSGNLNLFHVDLTAFVPDSGIDRSAPLRYIASSSPILNRTIISLHVSPARECIVYAIRSDGSISATTLTCALDEQDLYLMVPSSIVWQHNVVDCFKSPPSCVHVAHDSSLLYISTCSNGDLQLNCLNIQDGAVKLCSVIVGEAKYHMFSSDTKDYLLLLTNDGDITECFEILTLVDLILQRILLSNHSSNSLTSNNGATVSSAHRWTPLSASSGMFWSIAESSINIAYMSEDFETLFKSIHVEGLPKTAPASIVQIFTHESGYFAFLSRTIADQMCYLDIGRFNFATMTASTHIRLAEFTIMDPNDKCSLKIHVTLSGDVIVALAYDLALFIFGRTLTSRGMFELFCFHSLRYPFELGYY